MIEKNRLEELIKQGATIWTNYCGLYPIDLRNKEINIDKQYDDVLNLDDSAWGRSVNFNYLYETEEDAEFASKFQNIKRVETLNLPTWEMFIQLGIPFEFTSKNGECFYLELCDEEGIDKIVIYNKIGFISNVFSSLATKENYFEACKEARRLFLGESK